MEASLAAAEAAGFVAAAVPTRLPGYAVCDQAGYHGIYRWHAYIGSLRPVGPEHEHAWRIVGAELEHHEEFGRHRSMLYMLRVSSSFQGFFNIIDLETKIMNINVKFAKCFLKHLLCRKLVCGVLCV